MCFDAPIDLWWLERSRRCVAPEPLTRDGELPASDPMKPYACFLYLPKVLLRKHIPRRDAIPTFLGRRNFFGHSIHRRPVCRQSRRYLGTPENIGDGRVLCVRGVRGGELLDAVLAFVGRAFAVVGKESN